jgi:hypothetical protein
MVEPGSKKEAKLKSKSEWAESYEKKSAAKSKAKTAALKAKGKI